MCDLYAALPNINKNENSTVWKLGEKQEKGEKSGVCLNQKHKKWAIRVGVLVDVMV